MAAGNEMPVYSSVVAAHEQRLQRLEDDSRDTAAELSKHDSGIQHLTEAMVSGFNKIDSKLDTLTDNVASIKTSLDSDSNRIARLEDMKSTLEGHLKWLKKTGGGALIAFLLWVAKEVVGYVFR